MVKQKREQVLVFCSREICYSSGNFFAFQLGAAFEELGYEVTVCEFTKEDDFDEKLGPFIGRKFRLIVDFNSLLPRLAMDDGTPFIEQLDGPFYDYILDHPLFHYNGLVSKGKNFHAIVLDENQCEYVRRYHPQIKSVHMLPLGATKALFDGQKNAADHILFMGTYDKPEAVYEIVKASPEPIKSIMKDLIERRIADPLLPMEEALRLNLKTSCVQLSEKEFAVYMNNMYPVDAYIRDYFRKAAIDELLNKKIPVLVVGEGWEKYDAVNPRYLTCERPVNFELSFEKIAHEQLLLNVSPIFNRGVHDRVLAGMANRAAVLTDENPYLNMHFKDKQNIALYSLNKLETLSTLAGELMESKELREEIQKNAFAEFVLRHTWRARAERLLSYETGVAL